MDTQTVSYIKANFAEVLSSLREANSAVAVTQNGTTSAVLMSPEQFEQMQQSLYMLKIMALGEAELQAGETATQEEVFSSMRDKLAYLSTQSEAPAQHEG